jgi:class 3 adenylate cyclase
MNLKRLAQRIREMRERQGLKQADVARALQISAQAVSKWERGDNAPDIALLLGLSRLLGVTTDWLLGREEKDSTFVATVMCTSLNGFAARAAGMPPREVAAWANGLFDHITESVLCFEGVPVKYVGDGFLGFFSGARHADRALGAARHVRRTLDNPGLIVTLHSGDIYLGAIGHPEYAHPDIIGRTVNTAFLAMHWLVENGRGGLGITQSVADSLEEDAVLGPPAEAKIMGLDEPVTIYEPANGKS